VRCLRERWGVNRIHRLLEDKRNLADTGCRWLLALVFLFAGLPKLFDVKEFAGIIEAYGLVPEFALLPVAFLLAASEVVCAVGLLLREKWALHIATALLVLFICVLTYGIWLGLDIDCGCFGPEESEYKAFSSLRMALLRDLLLLLPLVYLYYVYVSEKIMKKGKVK